MKPADGWYLEDYFTNPRVTVLFNRELMSKFIVEHDLRDVQRVHALSSAAKECAEYRRLGCRCSAIKPIAGAPNSRAVTVMCRGYQHGRYAYREYRVRGRRVVLFFRGGWQPKDRIRGTRGFDEMVRNTDIRLLFPGDTP